MITNNNKKWIACHGGINEQQLYGVLKNEANKCNFEVVGLVTLRDLCFIFKWILTSQNYLIKRSLVFV